MKKIILILTLIFSPIMAFANTDSSQESYSSTIKRTICNILKSDDYSLIIPVNTWHNRLTYDKEKIDSYNERPWGIGFSKDYIDKKDNRHSLFVLKFQDSHNRWEPFLGYSFSARWAMNKKKDFYLLAGGILGITAREEYNYIPFPAPLPLFGLEYKRLVVESTYIPGGKNNGNVLFTWIRWKF